MKRLVTIEISAVIDMPAEELQEAVGVDPLTESDSIDDAVEEYVKEDDLLSLVESWDWTTQTVRVTRIPGEKDDLQEEE